MKRILASFIFLLAATEAFCATPVVTKADHDRAASLVGKMTLEEKCKLIAGQVDGFHTFAIERLGIPSVRMADGPQGVRNNTHSTYYPCGISLAAGWNRTAALGVGTGIGYDAKARGVGIMLCPGVNIYRSALNGRNFEYYGEDPYLASEMAAQYISGIQGSNVVATIKHFATNNSEYDRHWTSSMVDERTINELYFPTFRKAVEKAHVGAVMTSYNPVNGIHSAENAWLIKDNLRGAWGFDGLVMSDWQSTYTTYGCLQSGLDLEMPRAFELTEEKIRPLLENGVIDEAVIDEKCINILKVFSAFGFLDSPMKDESIPEDYDLSRDYAYKAAIEGPVLLKNAGVLPIKQSSRNNIVVCGPNADYVSFGGGSGKMTPFPERNVTLFSALSSLGKGYKVKLSDSDADMRSATAVIVAVGFHEKSEGEGFDRTYSLPKGQDDLILKAASLCDNVIVIINSGGEVDITPWADKVGAIVMAWYGGQEGGKALADMISGKVSPSGRLPITFWGSYEANPASGFYPKKHPKITTTARNRDPYPHSNYAEGLYLGYRAEGHFDPVPMFAFGYGLTYSSFAYSDLSVESAPDGGADVSFTLKNTGKYDASEVAQVYVAPIDPSVNRPAHELKGFEKVPLQKGKSARVSVHLGPEAFSYYDVPSHSWKVDRCSYTIQVGASADDIKLSEKFSL